MKLKRFIIASLYIISITLSSISLTGCSNDQDTKENENSVEIINILEDEKFNNTLYTLIREGSDDGSVYLVDGLMLSPEDTYNALEIKEKYMSDNAVYVKIDSNGTKYLYRFQLNNKGLIKSYIKYIVEA